MYRYALVARMLLLLEFQYAYLPYITLSSACTCNNSFHLMLAISFLFCLSIMSVIYSQLCLYHVLFRVP